MELNGKSADRYPEHKTLMPNPDNNPNRTDDDESYDKREDLRYMYHLMEKYKDKADRRVNSVTFQEKVKREREGEMALER